MTGKEILREIQGGLAQGTKLVKSTGTEHLTRLPFTDHMGDRVEISVSMVDDKAILDDPAPWATTPPP